MSRDITIAPGKPVGYQQLTVADSAVGLTVPLNANRALIIVQDAGIRYRDDGANPTSTVGMPLSNGQNIELDGRDVLSAIKFIRTSGTSAVLNISYYFKK